MNTDIFMSKEKIVETLNDFIFGNFEIPMKVKTAIHEAVCMLEAKDKTIDRVLEIIDKECEEWKTWDSHPEAIFENIRTAVLALKGGEHAED